MAASGKGTATDRLVLDSALEKVLGADEVPMECEELEHQEEQEKNEISFNEEKLTTLKSNSKSEVSQGGNMDMEIEFIIKNTNLEPSRLSELDEMESRCSANTINFRSDTSLFKSETKSGITAGQGGVKCVLARALEEEGVKWSQDVTHKR